MTNEAKTAGDVREKVLTLVREHSDLVSWGPVNRAVDEETTDDILALMPAGVVASTPFQDGTPIGRVDKHGTEIRCGDIVRYNNRSQYTKESYWNPEYRVIWDAPSFRMKHSGGGKPGDSSDFKLKYGGTNGDLEIIKPYNGAIAKAVNPGPAVPDGMVMVPKEITDEMTRAWCKERTFTTGYRAMLRAAPTAVN